MLTRSEVNSFISRFPDFKDSSPALYYAPRMPKAMISETEEVVAICRKFNDEVARPLSLELERKTFEDPDYLSWELFKKCNEWGLYTLWVPKFFGGKGYNMPSLSYANEEIGSVCLGISSIISVHYQGLGCILMCGNTRIAKKVMNEVLQGEKTGNPCTISVSITEPGAGSDTADLDLIDKGKITCHAKKVKGGYIVNGTKIFISMGHLATWNVLFAASDLKKPSENLVGLMVRKGMKGFSLGVHENKMGQRLCPASELIFEDCFVPDDLVMFDREMASRFTKKPYRDITLRYFDYLYGAARSAIGAWGTAAARGAFEAALAFANETELYGKPMINYEWVQCRLAEMYANVRLGRLAYTEANYAMQLRGGFKLLQKKPIYYYLKTLPRAFVKNTMGPMLDMPINSWLMGKWFLDWQKPRDQFLCAGLSSLAKFTGADLGVKNCQLALDLMGSQGLRHEKRVEKIHRDAKLFQIFEGTSQLNRVDLFKGLIAPHFPHVKVYEE